MICAALAGGTSSPHFCTACTDMPSAIARYRAPPNFSIASFFFTLTTFPIELSCQLVAQEKDAMQDPTLCEIEERAAIMEYDGKMSRVQAEQETARLYGFRDWAELLRKVKDA